LLLDVVHWYFFKSC